MWRRLGAGQPFWSGRFLCFWPCHTWDPSFLTRESNPLPAPAVEAQSLNHQTTREVPEVGDS